MASFTDDFNRANTSDLGAVWVEVSGDWSIVSQQLSPGATGGTIVLRAAGAMDSSDHSAQATIAATASVSHGVWCRGNSNISSGYLWRNDGTSWDLFSVVGSTFTVIGTYAAAAAPGDVVKVQAVGSTIKGYVNGVERVSVTNTAVTTGTSVGIRCQSASSIRFDDFAAADVTAGAALTAADANETAQPLTGTKATTLSPASVAETAQQLIGSKTGALGTALEAAATLTLAGAKTAPLPVAAQTEAAQPLTGAKSAALSPAMETSTARPVATDDVDVDVTVGAPYSTPYSAGAPHASGWEVGAPW